MSLRRVPMDKGEGGGNGDGDDDGDTKPDESQLGDAGKAALDKERDARKEAEKSAREEVKARRSAEKRAKDAEAALSEIEDKGDSNQSDTDKAVRDADRKGRKEATAETSAKFERRMLMTEILAVATGKLHTPSDAVLLLNLSDFEVPDPDADEAELIAFRETLAKAIEDLITDKPYLRSGKVTGDGDGGPKPTVTKTDEKLTPSQRLQRGYEANEKAG